MATARKIIQKAMQKIGVLTKVEAPSADEAADGLDTLNAMLLSWSNDSMLIYARTWETFAVTSGDGEYTIGSGGDFNTVRPINILTAYVRQATTDYNLDIISDTIYNKFIWDKNTQSIPQFINFDNAFPVAKIRLWPVPTSGYSLFLLSEKQLTNFTIDEEVALPPGWEQALIYNLAVLLSPEYGVPIDQGTYQIANDSKGAIRTAINKVTSMDSQPLSIGSNNIFSGYRT